MQWKLLLLLLFCLSGFCPAQLPPPPPIDTFSADQKIFEAIEVEAGYPGGPPAWRRFLEQNLKASVPVDNGAPAGYYTVTVRFVVTRDGSISDVKALTNLGYGMEQEVIRILKKSGKWLPGMQNNRYVNSYHTQPITFVVEDEELDITTETPHKLYTGIENRISIRVNKIKPEDLSVIITNGRITSLGEGNYSVKVNDTTRLAVITVYNTRKGNKQAGAESFEVRPAREVPDADKPRQ